MAKKVKKNYEQDAKGVIYLLIVFISFGLFLLFYTNKESLIDSDSLKTFLLLVILATGFLFGLMYLIGTSSSSRKRR